MSATSASSPTDPTEGKIPIAGQAPLPAGGTVSRFDFFAQSAEGMRIEGTIDAQNVDNAMARLAAMGLHVHRLHPHTHQKAKDDSAAPPPQGRRPLGASDFTTFNEQLAQLAVAGLPLEHGLRLIASDMRRGRLAHAIGEVADDLERGVPLGEAFDRHRGRFPTLYGRVIDAGVRSGNLGAVLLGVGQHQELLQRLRGALWRTLAYPMMVFLALALVLLFLGFFVLPKFQQIFDDFRIDLPFPTRVVLAIGPAIPYIALAVVLIAVGIPILWATLRIRGKEAAAVDRVILPLPIVGSVFRLSLIARWCDALRIGVAAGLDLPASIDLASDAVGSPRMRSDADEMKSAIESGRPLDLGRRRRRILPATIPAAIEMSAGRTSLPEALESLSQTYQRQADSRIAAVPAILTPIGVILIGISIGFVVLALLAPLISLIQGLSSSTMRM